ncbi:hypothetical protein SSX86_014186 [Deinandra increscens subsp. villosa]|uniref:Methyltransferase n=1 Tax=Deinandra increscens subsp. villosa TaxID=3103831 RepID=A0AAP0D923_9ASTR
MAIGKPRGNKRPSSATGSCNSSTVTTVVLVSLCVLALWIMLTSNSIITSPSKTTIPINTDVSSFLKRGRKIPIDTTQHKHVDILTNTDVYKDDEAKTGDDQETGQGYKLDDDRDWLAEAEMDPKHESGDNVVDDDGESLNDSDVGKQEAEEQQEVAKEEQEIETSSNEDSGDGSSEKTSTESTRKMEGTDDQQSDDQQSEKRIETSNEDDIRDLEDTDEERKKGIENEQEQEQEQHEEDDGPIESHSIAAETKSRVENQEAVDVKNKMEQAKLESITANTTRPMIKALDAGNSTVAKGDVNGYIDSYKWELCNVTDGADYIPCLDHNRMSRQCPNDPPVCLVPLPKDYKTPISWPQSRDKIWLHNMPSNALSDFKGNQNWVKVTGEFITFLKGALHYINFLQQAVPAIAWGKHTRVVLDIGCGVANFGGYLFDKDVLTMSFASKDDQESQIQFALERGIPAVSAVMATQRLPFPSRVFDLVHCVRCKVPWHKDGGILLLEANRLLRPGGYFVWSATPVYGTLEQDVQIWKEMSALTVALCWELVTIKKDKSNAVGVAIYRKPDSNDCYDVMKRPVLPPVCKPDDDPNFAWFAAALQDLKLWVMNVVNVDSPDTLPMIFERGLVGIYHDWCESFSTYPRTYDLLHADHLFSKVKQRCRIKGVIAEIDRVSKTRRDIDRSR